MSAQMSERLGGRRGFANRVFARLAPALARSKALKATNRPAYLLLKYSVNLLLVLIVLGLIAGLFGLVGGLVDLGGLIGEPAANEG